MHTWNGHRCASVRLAIALLAAALGMASVAGAGDALPAWHATRADAHPPRA